MILVKMQNSFYILTTVSAFIPEEFYVGRRTAISYVPCFNSTKSVSRTFVSSCFRKWAV